MDRRQGRPDFSSLLGSCSLPPRGPHGPLCPSPQGGQGDPRDSLGPVHSGSHAPAMGKVAAETVPTCSGKLGAAGEAGYRGNPRALRSFAVATGTTLMDGRAGTAALDRLLLEAGHPTLVRGQVGSLKGREPESAWPRPWIPGSAGQPWCPLAYRRITLISAFVFTRCSVRVHACVSKSPLYIATQATQACTTGSSQFSCP